MTNIAARQLSNCMIALSAGEFSHQIQLRGDPIELPELTISCFSSAFKRGIKLPTPPPIERIQFEVLEVSGQIHDPEISPEKAKFGKIIGITTKTKESSALRFDVGIGKRKDLLLSIAPHIRNEGTGDWESLSRRGFISAGRQIQLAYENLPQTKKQLEQVRRRMAKRLRDDQKKDLKAEHTAQLNLIEASYSKFSATSGLCDSIDGTAIVRIRIFTTIGSEEVDLAVSPPFPDGE